MSYLKKLRNYKVYISFYMVLCILMYLNEKFWEHESIAIICRIILYAILFFKGIKILQRYSRSAKKSLVPAGKTEFASKYRGFRISISFWWIAFIVLCGVVKYIWTVNYNYFFSLSFLLLATDLIFVNYACLLKIFSDPKGKVVTCCCGCPVRGWDLLMINTPLLFAYNTDVPLENIFTGIAMILAISSFFAWEKYKYILVEVRTRCKKSCNLKLCIENR